MGRRRTKSPAWLPKRCYPHRRQLLYYPPAGKPIPLGPLSDPSACLAAYARLVGTAGKRPNTMGDVIDKFLLDVVPRRAPRTQEDYCAYCAKLKLAFAHMLPDEIEITDLYDYHNARKAPVRANREITVLGLIFRHAIRWRAATRNPTIGFIYAEERNRDRLVRGSERRCFARDCPDWLRGYMTLKHLTGRRQGELLKLGLFSERPDGIVFRILKKRRWREVLVEWSPRLRRTWEWLKRLPRPTSSTMIFVASRGPRRGFVLTARGFKSAWQREMARWVAAGGERFHEHDLRAASGSAAKTDERARELLDQEDVRTTRRSYRRNVVQRMKPLS